MTLVIFISQSKLTLLNKRQELPATASVTTTVNASCRFSLYMEFTKKN